MSVLLAVLTVSCVSWIITKEVLFEDLREWVKESRWLYPVRCPYCLAPWIAVLVCVVQHVPVIWFFPVVWGAYWNISLFTKVRG